MNNSSLHLILALLLTLSFPSYPMNKLTQEEIDEASEFIELIANKDLIPKSCELINITRPYASFAENIYYLEDSQGNKLVIKKFKLIDDFVEEHKNLTREIGYINLVEELRKKTEEKLPIIVGHKGGIDVTNSQNLHKGFIVFDRAPGKIVSYYKNFINDLDDKTIINVYSKIGSQLGALDHAMLEYNNKILDHPDMHDDNIIYDEKSDQLYWIDIAGLSLISFSDDTSRLQSPFISDLTKKISKAAYLPSLKDEYVRQLNLINKYLLALKSFCLGLSSKDKYEEKNCAIFAKKISSTAKLEDFCEYGKEWDIAANYNPDKFTIEISENNKKDEN